MRLGSTGTHAGTTPAQRRSVVLLMKELRPEEVHEGDCVGSDVEVAQLARDLGVRVVSHPPTNPALRGFFPADSEWPPRPYLDRNRDVVDATDVLLACPRGRQEVLRSGTWATIRYARKVGKPVIIVWPSGEIDR